MNSSEVRRYLFFKMVPLVLALAGCESGGGGSDGREAIVQTRIQFDHWEVPFEYSAVVALDEELIEIQPGEERDLTVQPGAPGKLSVNSQSPFITCGFSDARVTEWDLREARSESIRLTCEFAAFVSLTGERRRDDFEQHHLITGGLADNTVELPSRDGDVLMPTGFSLGSLVFVAGNRFYQSPILQPSFGNPADDQAVDDQASVEAAFSKNIQLTDTQWSSDALETWAFSGGALYGIRRGANGAIQVVVSQDPMSPLGAFANLPSETGACVSFALAIVAETVLVQCEDELGNRSMFSLQRSAPGLVSGPFSWPDSVMTVEGIGWLFAESSSEQGSRLFSLFSGDSEFQETWLSSDKPVSVSYDRYTANSILINGTYQRGEDRRCSVFYELGRTRSIREIINLCDIEVPIEASKIVQSEPGSILFLGRSDNGETATSETSLLHIDDSSAGAEVSVTLDGRDLSGRLIDAVAADVGVFLFSTAARAEGCPLAPWACFFDSRIYFKPFGGLVTSELLVGTYRQTLFSLQPFVVQSPISGNRILFQNWAAESGNEIWTTDIAGQKTTILADLFEGELSTVVAQGYSLSQLLDR